MIEIIILVFLCIHIGKLAKKKGLKQKSWIVYTVLSWIAGEIVGITAGLMIFERTNLISIMLIGIAGAFSGYLLLKNHLNKIPDEIDDDINRIRVNDLYP